MHVLAYLGLLLLGLLCAANTAMTAPDRRPMQFEHITIEHGLSQSAALSLLQDSRGYVWIGTEDGLNRYDGYQFATYVHDPNDPSSLRNDFINALAEDSKGYLWVGTDGGGAARWNPATDQFEQLEQLIQGADVGRQVLAVSVAPSGAIWIGSNDKGLWIVSPDHASIQPTDVKSGVKAIRFDSDGFGWVGTNNGLFQLTRSGQTLSRFEATPRGLPSNQIKALAFDSGDLWIGTDKDGLVLLDLSSLRFRQFLVDENDQTALPSASIKSLFRDGSGRLWVGTDAGLSLLVDRQLGHFHSYLPDLTDPKSLSDNRVMSMVADRSGMMWVGTKMGGVNTWAPQHWSFGHNPATGEMGFGSSNVTGYAETADGSLWVSTLDAGVTQIFPTGETRRWTAEHPTAPLPTNRVTALLTDPLDRIWIATMGGGVAVLDHHNGALVQYTAGEGGDGSLPSNNVTTLFLDSRERIWIGTFGGGAAFVNDARDVRFVTLSHEPGNPQSLSDSQVVAFAEGHDGRIWMGTVRGGLTAWHPEAGLFQHYYHDANDPTSLTSNTVYTLHVDTRGGVWAGTRAGLNRLLPNSTFDALTMSDGLPNDSINGIQQAGSSLWLSTNRGLVRYEPAAGTMKVFKKSHGLQGDEFTVGSHYKTRKGELIFGGTEGFNRFRPDALTSDPVGPPVVLTSVQLFNQEIPATAPIDQLQHLELGYRDDVVTFEFAALAFRDPSQNQYRYQLEGFDEDWMELGTRRNVTYTNLSGGQYILKVVGSNQDGVWGTSGLEVDLMVESPPWATWWAYVIYTLLAAAALIGFARGQRRRLASQVEYSTRLREEVDARTTELATRNSELNSAVRKLEEASFSDALTGLRNRRFLSETIEADIRQALLSIQEAEADAEPAGLGFVMVDLDQFKPINDAYGHAAGDTVLLGVKDALQQACRTSDVIIRWGGDEFLVVAKGTNVEQTQQLAERIRASIAHQLINLGHGRIARVSASIGFACYPFIHDAPDRLDWETVTRIADTALYEAKQQRNCWVGYAATAQSSETDHLMALIQKDAQALVEDGKLDIRKSSRRSTKDRSSGQASA